MEIQNKALLLKHLHKFFCQADIPWVKLVWSLYDPGPPHAQSPRGSFWWKDVFSLIHIYRSFTKSRVGNGETTLFWKDFWHKDVILCEHFPHLYSFVLEEDSSVADMVRLVNPNDAFALPLSSQAYEELEASRMLLSAHPFDANQLDTRSFTWGNDSYSAARYYKFVFGSLPCPREFTAIWKSKCLPKLKVFLWLLLHDRLNTKDLMTRKHWTIDGGPACSMCSSGDIETRDHLFFECSFASSCWDSIGISWDLQRGLVDRIYLSKTIFSGACFWEVFACSAWNIWKARNDYIFNLAQPSLGAWMAKTRADLLLHQYRVKGAHVQPLLLWIRDFLT